MPKQLHIARWLVTIPTVMFGVIPLIVDISETHVLHPAWPPHARFHTVWLITTNFGIAALAIHLLWSGGLVAARVRLAGLLGTCVIGGFWIAALTQARYGGAFGDPGGVPPIAGLDANAVVFTGELLSLAVALGLVARSSRGSPAYPRPK